MRAWVMQLRKTIAHVIYECVLRTTASYTSTMVKANVINVDASAPNTSALVRPNVNRCDADPLPSLIAKMLTAKEATSPNKCTASLKTAILCEIMPPTVSQATSM